MTKAQQTEVFVKRGDGRWFDQAEVVLATANPITKQGTQTIVTMGGDRYTFKDGKCITKFNNTFYRVEVVS